MFAIKRLFSSDERDFKRETEMLTALTNEKHQYLVQLLATYKYKGKYHLLFPFANANLRGLWTGISTAHRRRETTLWALDQMTGLASGLVAIHDYHSNMAYNTEEGNPGLTRFRKSKQLVMEPGEAQYGRHGDLKPENILWSGEVRGAEISGILQIADLGLGHFHRLESRSRVDPSKSKSISIRRSNLAVTYAKVTYPSCCSSWGTFGASFTLNICLLLNLTVNGSPTYTPPEVALDQDVSRAYDIWSLGCVFLEFATWLLEGPAGLEEFTQWRMEIAPDGIKDDTFYSLDSGGAILRRGVQRWIEHLQRPSSCSETVHIGMLLDLLLEEPGLLVVEPKSRISALNLYKKLKEIFEKAKGSNE
jgi:serine/threonine protein kinase